MHPLIPHRCTPGEYCPVCALNVMSGGSPNHASNLSRPSNWPAADATALATCSLLGTEAVRIPGSLREWRRCLSVFGSNVGDARDGHCCACQTPVAGVFRIGVECGPKCPGYQDPAAAELPRWRPVAPPTIRPTSARAVVTVVVGEEVERLHALTGPSQQRYAERMRADYVVVRGRTQDERMPCGEKWRVKDYVPLWPGGTLYLDADVWVRPDAPDVWDVVPADTIGLVDSSPQMPNLLKWAEVETADILRSQGIDPAEAAGFGVYYNSGVWLGRPEHAGYWEPPTRPYPAKWCTEELWCRWRVKAAGLKVSHLDPRFNWTWHTDRDLQRAIQRPPYFYHFAGMGNSEAERIDEWKQPNGVWRLALLRLLEANADRR